MKLFTFLYWSIWSAEFNGKKIQDQQFLTFEYYSDWQPSLFRSLCKNNTKIEWRGHFSHYRVNSSCEQVVATLRPSLSIVCPLSHFQVSLRRLTAPWRRLASPTRFGIFWSLITVKACLVPNANSVKGGCLERAVLTAGISSNIPSCFHCNAIQL